MEEPAKLIKKFGTALLTTIDCARALLSRSLKQRVKRHRHNNSTAKQSNFRVSIGGKLKKLNNQWKQNVSTL